MAEPDPVEPTLEPEPEPVAVLPALPALPPLDITPSDAPLERDEVLRALARSVGASSPPPPARPVVMATPPPAPPPAPAPEPDVDVPLPPKVEKPARPPREPRQWNSGLVVALTVLALVLVVVLVKADGGTGGPTTAGLRRPAAAAPAAKPKPAAPTVETIRAEASSVDPSGGSGLRREGDAWRTQTYTSATFGNLKDGVGLLLDVGTARAVTSVTLDVEGPLDVELRAGDEPAGDGDAFTEVTTSPGADGQVELKATDGGEHRYWLVWVTKLAPAGGGYQAVLSTPVVRGPAS